jgi:exosortase
MTPSNSSKSEQNPVGRTALRLSILGVSLSTLILFWPSVKALATLSFQDERYGQILAAPLICLLLIYCDREKIFSVTRYSPRVGIPLLSLAILLCLIFAPWQSRGEEITRLVPVALAIILVWQAAFILCYGTQSWKLAMYPLCCLFLAIPIPPSVINWLTVAYQHGSAAASYAILDLVGVPVLRNGMVFSIPGLNFKIAEECSGIRSGVAFLMVGIVASRLYLRSRWARLVLMLSTIPMAMFKNAVRIVVIASLAAYVDRAFIEGPFHHKYGGVVFLPVDFLLFVPLVLVLQKLERRSVDERTLPSTSASPILE